MSAPATAPPAARDSWLATYGRRLLVVLGVAVLFVLLISFSLVQSQPSLQIVRIATGSKGGTHYVIGAELARLLNLQSDAARQFQAELSNGDLENVNLLLEKKAEFAFAGGSVLNELAERNPDLRKKVKVVARLYPSSMQVVIRRDFPGDVQSLEDLKEFVRDARKDEKKPRLRAFAGAPNSGTRIKVETLLAAQSMGLDDFTVDETISSYHDAARRLLLDDDYGIDLAFLPAGFPTDAVAYASANGCKLIDVPGTPSLGKRDRIPRRTYEFQQRAVYTVTDHIYLVCREDVDQETVAGVAGALFDNLYSLVQAHPAAAQIELHEALNEAPDGFDWHAGISETFAQRDADTIWIATGPCDRVYFELGRDMQAILREQGVSAHVIPTEGSLENLALLQQDRPVLGIVQYDVAVAAVTGQPKTIYKQSPEELLKKQSSPVPPMTDLRRVVGLHEELLYGFSNKKLSLRDLDQLADLGEAEMSFGPEFSGTQLIARAVLAQTPLSHRALSPTDPAFWKSFLHHGPREQNREIGAKFKKETLIPLAFDNMVKQLVDGDLRVGFVVASDRDRLLGQILAERGESVELIPLEEGAIRRVEGQTFWRTQTEIDGDPKVPYRTIGTRALLVANPAVDGVEEITAALFEGASRLTGVNEEDLKQDLAFVPLHPEAKRYYELHGFVPQTQTVWTKTLSGFQFWSPILGSFFGLALAMTTLLPRGANMVKESISSGWDIKILSVPVDNVADGVPFDELRDLRRELARRVRVSWFNVASKVSMSRWRKLESLISDRLSLARDSLCRTLFARISELDSGVDPPADAGRQAEYERLRASIVEHTQRGDLDRGQYEMLVKLLPGQRAAAEEEATGESAGSSTRDTAAEGLTDQRVRELLEQVDGEDRSAAAAAEEKLSGLHGAEFVLPSFLLALARHRAVPSRLKEAIFAGDDEVLRAVGGMLVSKEQPPEVRQAAADVLHECLERWPGDPAEAFAQVTPALLAASDPAQEDSWQVRQEAVRILRKHPASEEVAAALERAAQDSDPHVQETARADADQ